MDNLTIPRRSGTELERRRCSGWLEGVCSCPLLDIKPFSDWAVGVPLYHQRMELATTTNVGYLVGSTVLALSVLVLFQAVGGSGRSLTSSFRRSAVLVVRTLRPFAVVLLWNSWWIVRLWRWLTGKEHGRGGEGGAPTTSSISLLELLVHFLRQARTSIVDSLALLAESSSFLSREGSVSRIVPWSIRTVDAIWGVLEDVVAACLVLQLIRLVYCLYQYPFNEWMDRLVQFIFDFSRHQMPFVQRELDAQVNTVMAQSANDMLHKDPHRKVMAELPQQGQDTSSLLLELTTCSNRENEKWKQGKTSGTVYTDDALGQHSAFLTQVYQLYAWGNPLHPGYWPKMNQCEAEVVTMAAHLFHAPFDSNNTDQPPSPYGCVTSGGTESIILAIRAHWHHYGIRRGIAHPELVCSSTAHAAVHKACDMFGIRVVMLDCNHLNDTTIPRDAKFQLSPHQVRRHITSNTILIFASAPCYPQGVIDPIEELSTLALEYDIGMHVDACLGGFVLAFLSDPIINENKSDPSQSPSPFAVPTFDFRHPGVTSLSADTHKYGYAPKGTSVILYRSRALRHGQYFCYPHWTGGMYATPTIAGSRPGALSVCAWAALRSIGRDKYAQYARRIATAAQSMATAIRNTPGLQLLTPNPTVVVCFTSASPFVDVYRVRDSMAASGWLLNELQNPPCVHVCVTLSMTHQVATFARDLKTAVAHVKAEGRDGQSRGTAGIYGAVAALPDGPVECVLNAFTDLALAP